MKEKELYFLNESYRKLLKNGRTYASYTNEELDIIFRDIKKSRLLVNDILDPMSGYGGLMKYCQSMGITTYNLEVNAPAYYWQFLNLPQNSSTFEKIIKKVLSINLFPKINKVAISSDDYFSEEGIKLSLIAYKKIMNIVKSFVDKTEMEDFALSVTLPFIYRLSNSTKGDITHIKKGGILILKGLNDDFKIYLKYILEKIILINIKQSNKHYAFLGEGACQFSRDFFTQINKQK